MEQITTYLKAKWPTLLLVGLLFAFIAVLIVRMTRKTETVVEVAAPAPVDSVFTAPSRSEQTAQARWDSLKTIQP